MSTGGDVACSIPNVQDANVAYDAHLHHAYPHYSVDVDYAENVDQLHLIHLQVAHLSIKLQYFQSRDILLIVCFSIVLLQMSIVYATHEHMSMNSITLVYDIVDSASCAKKCCMRSIGVIECMYGSRKIGG